MVGYTRRYMWYTRSSFTSNPTTDNILMRDTSANLKQATMDLSVKVLVIEERSTFLGDLLKLRRGTREVERYVRKQESIRHESKEYMNRDDIEEMMLREKEIIMNSMNNKLSDNIAKGIRKGRELSRLKSRLFWGMRKEEKRRKFRNMLNDILCKRSKEVRNDHAKGISRSTTRRRTG